MAHTLTLPHTLRLFQVCWYLSADLPMQMHLFFFLLWKVVLVVDSYFRMPYSLLPLLVLSLDESGPRSVMNHRPARTPAAALRGL